MSASHPITFILTHKNFIIPLHYQNGKKVKKTWHCLKESLPELQESMKFNTFKQYLSVITAIATEVEEDTERKNEVRQKLSNQTVHLQGQLDRVRQKDQTSTEVRQGLDNPIKRISGWNVRKSNDGYYRCYRKIRNQVHCVYLGRELDVQKAQHRIKEKENKLKLDKS